MSKTGKNIFRENRTSYAPYTGPNNFMVTNNNSSKSNGGNRSTSRTTSNRPNNNNISGYHNNHQAQRFNVIDFHDRTEVTFEKIATRFVEMENRIAKLKGCNEVRTYEHTVLKKNVASLKTVLVDTEKKIDQLLDHKRSEETWAENFVTITADIKRAITAATNETIDKPRPKSTSVDLSNKKRRRRIETEGNLGGWSP